jgi:hypothetical protein
MKFKSLSHSGAAIFAALTSASFSAGTAIAQSDINTDQLQEIVVTAQRRAEDLQRVPIAITAISNDTLTAQNLTNLQDLSNVVPGLDIGNNTGFGLIFIRGVGAIRYDKNKPINDSPWKPAPDPMNWPPPLPTGRAGRWGQNRMKMKNGSFSGFEEHFLHEDLAVAVSQGKIAKRAHEFLNAGDAAVVRMRKELLVELDQYRNQGKASPAPDASKVTIKAGQLLLDEGTDWRTQVLV